MERPTRCRRICIEPAYDSFRPEGIPTGEKITMTVDEYEVIRLVDLKKYTHGQCAQQMGISRTTVTEIYESARYKLADSLVHGKVLSISGGNYCFCDGRDPFCCNQKCERTDRSAFENKIQGKGEKEMRLGERQKLIVVKKVEFGVYLAERQDAGEKDRVLLPIKQVPAGTKEGDKLEVFLYKDSQDRLIATMRQPKLMLGETGFLRVAQVSRIGAFLDWGLEKDLFLPYKEQTKKVHENEEVLVSVYIDKSSRLCATMKVYHYLQTNSPYTEGDTVTGTVYESSDNFGVFIAVDGKYSGMIPRQEAQGNYKAGEELTCRVTAVREDGKLTLSGRQKAHIQLYEDAESVYSIIEDFEGVLPFDDKASPEVIQREFGLSKNAFKRAVGHLLKEKKIAIKDGKIYLL